MLDKQMAHVPEQQREQFIAMIEENPQFFQDIALQAQAYEKQGMDRMQAVAKALEEKKDEAERIFKK